MAVIGVQSVPSHTSSSVLGVKVCTERPLRISATRSGGVFTATIPSSRTISGVCASSTRD